MLTPDSVLDFGRYKGEQLKDVVRNNPQYVLWAIDIGVLVIDSATLDELERSLRQYYLA